MPTLDTCISEIFEPGNIGSSPGTPPTVITPAPIITSSDTDTVAENATLSHELTSNRRVTWSIVGGADNARFELSGSTLRWAGNGTKDYDAPDDADTNNTYVVTVRATRFIDVPLEGVTAPSTDQTITVTVTEDVAGEGTPIGLLLALTRAPIVTPPSSYANTETDDLASIMSPTPSVPWLTAVDDLITDLKTAASGDIWSTFDLFHCFSTETPADCTFNWVDTSVGLLTENGTINYSASEYAASDGSTGYFSTTFSVNSGNATDGDAAFGYFCLTEESSDAVSPFQSGGGKHTLGIQSSSSGASIASMNGKLNTSTDATFSSRWGSTVGHFVLQQNTATQLEGYLDGVSLGTSTETHSVDTGTVQIFKSGSGTTRGIAFTHYGSALTDAQHLDLSKALYNFLAAIDVRPMAGYLGGSTGPTNIAPYKRVAVGTGNSLSMPVCMTPGGEVSGLLQCNAGAYGYNAIRVNDPNYLNIWRFEIHDGDNAPFDGGSIDRVQVTTLSALPIDMGDTVDVAYSFFIESGSTNDFSFCDLINLHAQSETGQNPFAHALEITTGKFYSWVYDSGTTTETDSTKVTIAQGVWHHVRTTLTTGVSGMAQTWLNGVQILNYTGTVGGSETDPFWFNLALYRGGNTDNDPAAVWYANIEIDTSGTQPYADRVTDPLPVPSLT